MTTQTLDPRWLLLAALSLGCGDDPPPAVTNDYALSGVPPLPEHLASGDHVRTLVVGHAVRAGADRRDQQCSVTALLFDANERVHGRRGAVGRRHRLPLLRHAPRGRLRPPALDLCGRHRRDLAGRERAARAVPRRPDARAELPVHPARVRLHLAGNGSAHLASMDEGIPGDVLTDLNTDVALPGGVVIHSPSELTTVTWPESGDLTVTWTGAGATSAVVRLEPTDPAATSVIVCNPRRNGTQRVPADMIAQAMFRTQDVKGDGDGVPRADGDGRGRTHLPHRGNVLVKPRAAARPTLTPPRRRALCSEQVLHCHVQHSPVGNGRRNGRDPHVV